MVFTVFFVDGLTSLVRSIYDWDGMMTLPL